MIKCIPLGISSSTPTKDRNTTSLAIKYEKDIILFDCGEGAQKQMMKCKLSYMDINSIFISHFHADHFIGIAGLLATMSMQDRNYDIYIFGPKGIQKKIDNIVNTFGFNLTFKINCYEIVDNLCVEYEKYTIKCIKIKHSVENFGFIMEEKKLGKFDRQKAESLGIPKGPLYQKLKEGFQIEYGGKTYSPDDVLDYSNIEPKRVGYFVDLLDTSIKDKLGKLDIIFHEAMFLEKDDVLSKNTMHSTVKNVAKMLKNTSVKKWIMINFSARYNDLNPLLEEAKKHFENSQIGEELKEYII